MPGLPVDVGTVLRGGVGGGGSEWKSNSPDSVELSLSVPVLHAEVGGVSRLDRDNFLRGVPPLQLNVFIMSDKILISSCTVSKSIFLTKVKRAEQYSYNTTLFSGLK